LTKKKGKDEYSEQAASNKPPVSKSVNPKLTAIRKKREALLSAEHYAEKILEGDRIVLSKAITLIESTRESHQQLAQHIIEQCIPHSGKAIRIGITGTPGVGKSTFIEKLGKYILQKDRKLAVLAIDPSSQVSKGSILGDKTRMAELSADPNAYIRPSPAGQSLGGVGRCTRSTIILCEAAGFDTIFVETVGVGQSETVVHSMVDFFLLLLLPGAGDELQGIKRGIVEMADLIAINKADGDRLSLAKRSRQSYKNALHLFPPKESGWSPPVVLCSALSQLGLDDIWQLILDYIQHTQANQYFDKNRQKQALHWLHETINTSLKNKFLSHQGVQGQIKEIEQAVLNGQISSFKGAELLLQIFLNKNK